MFIIRLGKMLSMSKCFQVKNSFWKNLTVCTWGFSLLRVWFFFFNSSNENSHIVSNQETVSRFSTILPSHTRTHTHSVAFSFSSLSFFFFLITGERKKGKKRKTMFERNTLETTISFILIIWTYFKPCLCVFLCTTEQDPHFEVGSIFHSSFSFQTTS